MGNEQENNQESITQLINKLMRSHSLCKILSRLKFLPQLFPPVSFGEKQTGDITQRKRKQPTRNEMTILIDLCDALYFDGVVFLVVERRRDGEECEESLRREELQLHVTYCPHPKGSLFPQGPG